MNEPRSMTQPRAMTNLVRTGSWLALSVLALAAIVACGGDDAEADSTPVPTEAATEVAVTDVETAADEAADSTDTEDEAEDEAATGDASTDTSDTFDFGTGTAVVTLGDERYEVDQLGICRDVFDMIQASGTVADGRDITLEFSIPPLDWESYEDQRYDPPSVEVEDDEANKAWRADAGYAQENDLVGDSQVDSYEKDGLYAKGTATFVDRWMAMTGEVETVEGTFEIRCEEA